jgi:hypothetical protein
VTVRLTFWCDECQRWLIGAPPPYSRRLPSGREEHACSDRCRDALLAKIDKHGRPVTVAEDEA